MTVRSIAKAVFLDRDGVINIDHGYVHSADKFELFPGVLDACRCLHKAGYKIIVVTNQSGIGRGFYTLTQFFEFTSWIEKLFREFGAPITATYYCPHHPEMGLGKYLKICDCRKPAPGMLQCAIHDYDLDVGNSFIVGDKQSDIEAARAVGVRGYLVGNYKKYNSLAELVEALYPTFAKHHD
jgi:D-glycero-D-manno-heptose 1,7-bisphosphate phosphatase